ncbi:MULTISPECIES: hypothetical protein [unclassified Nocardioides]|uniref:hypothetical protein n=1 Tax=unclassified Nocardioides TaxID=2615069 RepID=UPI003615DB16
MPLDEGEWDTVQGLVEDYLVGTADPYGALKDLFPDLVAQWTITAVPARNARYIVLRARNVAPGDPDPFSIRLLDGLLRIKEIGLLQATEFDRLRDFRDRLERERQAFAKLDPFAARVLGSGEIFINRVSTRKLLRDLTKPEPKRPVPLAMRVIGESRLGKSYTYSFILHLSGFVSVQPVPVYLDESYTAADILRDVSTKIAPEGAEPRSVDDPAKRLAHWADWIVARANESTDDRAFWFVFDQCNELDPSSDAVELIAHLARVIKSPAIHEPARTLRPKLVLLGYNDQLPDLGLPPKQVFVDTVTEVDEHELTRFFDHVFREVHEEVHPEEAPDEAQLASQVADSVQRATEDAKEATTLGQCYMEALAESAADAIDLFREEAAHVV